MGNICRSPTAHGVFRHKLRQHGLDDQIRVDSAGTHNYHPGEPPDRRSQRAAAMRGYDLSDLREQRIAESDADLPSFFWITAVGLLAVAFVLGLLAADNLATSVSLGAAAAAVALIFAFVAIVDQPFEGDTSVKPKEILRALAPDARRT